MGDDTIECNECGGEMDIQSEECPHCGFGPETCSHPIKWRDSNQEYVVEEDGYVDLVRCGKCYELL